MKIISSILILTILFSFNPPKSKSYIKWKSDKNFRKIEKVEEKLFDSIGNLVNWKQYSSFGVICEKFEYEFENEKIKKSYRTNCNSYKKSENFKLSVYDKGRITEKITYRNGEISKISKFEYRNEIDKFPSKRKDYYDNEKVPTEVATLQYDSRWNLINETSFVSGSWFGTHTYLYNSKGKLTYETGQVDGGVGLVETYYIYENEKLVRDSIIIPESKTKYHIYEYK